jgi:hypothetical protein
MVEYWIAIVVLLVFVLLIYLVARNQNREAAKQGGRNPAQFRFGFGRNRLNKGPEKLYTEDGKINRNWKS